MILIKDNIEKIADTEEAAGKLIEKGFRLLYIPPAAKPAAAVPDPAAFKTGTAGFNSPETKKQDLRSMKVQELRNLAKARGISGTGSMTKAEILELLEE